MLYLSIIFRRPIQRWEFFGLLAQLASLSQSLSVMERHARRQKDFFLPSVMSSAKIATHLVLSMNLKLIPATQNSTQACSASLCRRYVLGHRIIVALVAVQSSQLLAKHHITRTIKPPKLSRHRSPRSIPSLDRDSFVASEQTPAPGRLGFHVLLSMTGSQEPQLLFRSCCALAAASE